MPPVTLEQQMKETADKIEAALQDVKKNTATKKEVLDLIEERSKDDRERIIKSRADIDVLNTGIAEVSKTIEDLKKQIKLIGHSSARSLFEGGRYKGNFASPQEAKAFALICLAATMASEPRLKTRYDEVRKQLDGMGIEPYFIDANGHSVKAMTGSSQAGGGALATFEQLPTLITLLEQYGVARANFQQVPMGAGTTLVPKISGLLTMYCPGEGGTVTAATPSIATISMTTKTLCGLTAYSLELEDDSLVALGELLGGLFARSCAYYEDLCGFLGDGTSTYFGFVGIVGALRAVNATIANIKSLIVGAGNAYSELTLANFNSVIGNLPQYADDGNAAWYEHRYFYYTVFVALALAAGGAQASEVIVGAGQRQKLQLSYPVNFTHVMPKAEANSQICSIFGNLRQGAYLGTRGGIEIATSDQRYFDQGLMAILCRDRITINAHGVGDTTSAGPICGLITAAN